MVICKYVINSTLCVNSHGILLVKTTTTAQSEPIRNSFVFSKKMGNFAQKTGFFRPDLCEDAKIDAITTIWNRDIYVFKGEIYGSGI